MRMTIPVPFPKFLMESHNPGPNWKDRPTWVGGSSIRCLLPKITSFWILKIDQNISKAIKDLWEVPSVVRRCTTWNTWAYSCRTLVEHVHHTSVREYAQSRGDQINIQRVWCLCPLSLALYHCWVMAWALIWVHDGERLATRCRLPF